MRYICVYEIGLHIYNAHLEKNARAREERIIYILYTHEERKASESFCSYTNSIIYSRYRDLVRPLTTNSCLCLIYTSICVVHTHFLVKYMYSLLFFTGLYPILLFSFYLLIGFIIVYNILFYILLCTRIKASFFFFFKKTNKRVKLLSIASFFCFIFYFYFLERRVTVSPSFFLLILLRLFYELFF